MQSAKGNPAPPWLGRMMPAACVIFAAWIAGALLTSRVVYADGASEFLTVLQAQGFVSLWWSRHFAFYLYEFPLVLAIKLGVTHLAWLRFAYGLGCFWPWPAALACCHWISPRHFWLAAAGCGAGYLNAAFTAVGEHILAHALFWPPLFVILFAGPLKPGAAIILLASATGLLFSYESQLFLCAPLAALAGWRAWRERTPVEGRQEAGAPGGWSWAVFLAAAALFAAGVFIAGCAVVMPENGAEMSGLRAGASATFIHPSWTFAWTLIWAGLTAGVCFSEKLWRLVASRAGLYLLFIAVAVWGTWPWLEPGRLDNGKQWDDRLLDLAVPLALLPVALLARFRPGWFEARRGRIVPLVAALLMAQSLWQLTATVNWYRDVVWLREILASKTGIVSARSTALAVDGMEGRELYKKYMGGRFDWVWPSLSIALAPDRKINCLLCSDVFLDPTIRRNYWEPFDPLKPWTLPKLEHYGVDYSGYVAGLKEKGMKGAAAH